MTEIMVILICFAAREAFSSLPSIIWSIRCPADSSNYSLPTRSRPMNLLIRRDRSGAEPE